MKRKIPDVLLPGEQELLLDQFLPSSEEDGERQGGRPVNALTRLRDLCLVRLMLNSGLRCAEALAVRLRDLEPATGKLLVHGKGSKERVLWLCEADVNLIMGYINGQPNGPEDLIFRNLQGKPLTSRYVHYMVQGAARAAGLTKTVYPHILRHSFATDLLRATKNLRVVQKALGHESLRSTQIYTHISDPELEEAMKNFRNGG